MKHNLMYFVQREIRRHTDLSSDEIKARLFDYIHKDFQLSGDFWTQTFQNRWRSHCPLESLVSSWLSAVEMCSWMKMESNVWRR